MNKFAVLILLASTQLIAQTKSDNSISPNARIYEPKYLRGDRAMMIARFVTSVSVSVFVQWEPVVNGFTLKSEHPIIAGSELLDRAEALLKRFDVPPPPERLIEMTIHLIRAYGRPAGQVSVPPELASVVKEMKGALPYGGFELADTIQVNVRNGLRLEDALPTTVTHEGGITYFYNMEFHEPSISADGKVVSLGGFRFGLKVPVNTNGTYTYQDVGIATPLTIYQDQKQVLGKLKLQSGSPDDFFVVLSYKLK